MEKISIAQIAGAVNGRINGNCDLQIDAICIDTHRIVPGCLFIAIIGENYDGHDFIEKALKLGAAAIVSSQEIYTDKTVVIVKDTRNALLDIARLYRSLFSAEIVGVTGSVGKTSTKEMIYTILSSKFKTLKTQGNLNNEIGLPLTLFNLDTSHEAAVVEMGMSNLNEISRLSKTLCPDIGVITNIGISHIETLGSRENILKAKLEILDGMESGAPLILNGDDDMLVSVQEHEHSRDIIYYGIQNSNADVKACDIICQNMNTEFDILCYGKKIHVKIPVVGIHNVYNALAAFCVGMILEIPFNTMAEAFKSYQNAPLRQNIQEINGITVIEDCYNASPGSMHAAIEVLNALECKGKRVAVLGDMLELGEYSEQAHRSIGDAVAKSSVDLLICYGKDAWFIKESAIVNGMVYAHFFKDKEDLVRYIKENIQHGDVVLFKASRRIKLEEVVAEVYKEC